MVIKIILDDANLLLPVSRVTAVSTVKEMIHFDKLNDGTWRIIYNSNMLPEFSKVLNFEIVRK
jgi:hypothetical protein